MPTYDIQQQVFALSMAVNAAYKSTGSSSDIEADLNKALTGLLGDTNIQTLIGEWSVVWGPAVWEHPFDLRGYSDNTVAVFHNAASNTYVCATAATNSNSIFDWAVEDFWVSDKVRWEYTPTNDVAWISAATNFGIGMLLSLRDPNTQVFLSDYLKSVANTNATLVFAGHSLAGALSPTLALALYGTAQARAAWKQVVVYPTAGATPGNVPFANAFAAQFPAQTTGSQPWQKWNTVLWNQLDVVPHAWGPVTMAQVPTLYECTLAVKAELGAIVAYAVYKSAPGLNPLNSWYWPVPNAALTGSTQKGGTISSLGQFITELGYQHVDAYFTLLGMTELQQYLPGAAAVPAAVAAAPAASATGDQPLQDILALAQKAEADIQSSGVLDLMKL
jgi:hypothetical protein